MTVAVHNYSFQIFTRKGDKEFSEMNAFVQKLPGTYSVMKINLRETPIQERKKIETTAEMPLFHG